MWKKFLSSPVLYTNSKYISYIWTVLYLYILTPSNISEIYMTAYFEDLCDMLYALRIHSASKHFLPFNSVAEANISFVSVI